MVSNDLFIRHTRLCIACPITNTRRDYPSHVTIPEGQKLTGVVMVEQVKSIDFHSRDVKRIGSAPESVYSKKCSRSSMRASTEVGGALKIDTRCLVRKIGRIAFAAVLVSPLPSCTAAPPSSARVEAHSELLDITLSVTPLEGTRDSTFTALVSMSNRSPRGLNAFPNVRVFDSDGVLEYDYAAGLRFLRGYTGVEIAPGEEVTLPVPLTLPTRGRYTIQGVAHVREPVPSDISTPRELTIEVR